MFGLDEGIGQIMPFPPSMNKVKKRCGWAGAVMLKVIGHLGSSSDLK